MDQRGWDSEGGLSEGPDFLLGHSGWVEWVGLYPGCWQVNARRDRDLGMGGWAWGIPEVEVHLSSGHWERGGQGWLLESRV